MQWIYEERQLKKPVSVGFSAIIGPCVRWKTPSLIHFFTALVCSVGTLPIYSVVLEINSESESASIRRCVWIQSVPTTCKPSQHFHTSWSCVNWASSMVIKLAVLDVRMLACGMPTSSSSVVLKESYVALLSRIEYQISVTTFSICEPPLVTYRIR